MFCGGFRGFGGYGYGSSGSIGYGWTFLAMGFRMLLFVGLIILGVKLFKSYKSSPDDTMRILDQKFAKGDICQEEYLRRKTILSQKN